MTPFAPVFSLSPSMYHSRFSPYSHTHPVVVFLLALLTGYSSHCGKKGDLLQSSISSMTGSKSSPPFTLSAMGSLVRIFQNVTVPPQRQECYGENRVVFSTCPSIISPINLHRGETCPSMILPWARKLHCDIFSC